MRKKIEENIHQAICKYIKLQYPFVIFHSDASGLRLPIGQATAFSKLKSEKAIPDLFIAEPVGKYAGLYIEIKKDKSEVFTKGHKIRQTAHIQQQYKMIFRLNTKGYYATFGCGFDSCKAIIDNYLNEFR